jgi:flagellar motility protein MotE (MotC chaperone)
MKLQLFTLLLVLPSLVQGMPIERELPDESAASQDAIQRLRVESSGMKDDIRASASPDTETLKSDLAKIERTLKKAKGRKGL